MPLFTYKAFDRKANKEVSDSVEASSQVEAIAAIKKQGLLPIEVKEAKSKAAKMVAQGKSKGGSINIPGMGSGVKPAQVTLFTRQLSTLQDAGLPIVQSLQILTDMQRPGKFKDTISQVTEEVQGGSMLSEAMARHPKIWDRLYTNLVKAGETAGALDAILRRLAEFREKAQKLKKKVVGALIYPVAVLTIAVGILSFIMIMIVPKFEQIFRELGIKLPGLTLLLIDMSNIMGNWWYIILATIVFLVIGTKIFRGTEVGGNIVDRMMLRVPVLGNVVKKSSVARFTRTLGTLVTSGVGFLDALEITRNATPNIVVRNAIQAVRDSVKEGETINEPLRRSGIFDDIVVNMIKVGEETGELDRMLTKIADNYDEEVDAAVAGMMALMEPALIIFMGGAVGFIVIALFMPLISIIEQLNSGGGA
ncbi:MAG: type II secretion system F family protein [Planctomycetes bacterium]|nr:type II secretion system F family protein [Planctomycetota bacterium]